MQSRTTIRSGTLGFVLVFTVAALSPSDMLDAGVVPSFQGLGGFGSVAQAVSADGSVVVGTGASAFGTEAFRWTADDGMVGLGDLPGGGFFSAASGMSADGSTVVGNSFCFSIK